MESILRVRGGSSVASKMGSLLPWVFSAYAEVVPEASATRLMGFGILRVRGGSSIVGFHVIVHFKYSPRTRR